jgi:DNA polymerase-3 subunit gamma/tau
MAAQALYRKWRPQTFDAVVGQEHVTRTLRNALRGGRVGHAYLFTGPRGTGKTTTARLLAKAVNCQAETPDDRPCNECAICQALNEGRLLDLIEIDAASNRGIDEIRELRERVGFRPNEARYKVYVIDEVHMLTEPAFNALLKTLEEPPPHVIFVLATTEPHKIPETILSRCQRFDFRRLTVSEIVGRLADLAEREGLQFEPEALTAIARQATGSVRDAESLLDQLIAYSDEAITREQVQAVLGTGSLRAVSDLVGRLAAGDVAGGLDAINRAVDEGIAPGQLNRQVVEYLRGLMLLQVGDGDQSLNLPQETLDTMRDQAAHIPFRQVLQSVKLFNEAGRALKGSLHPQLPLELAFIEAATPDLTQPAASPAEEAATKVPPQPPNRSSTEMPSTPTRPLPAVASPAPERLPATRGAQSRTQPIESKAAPAEASAGADSLSVEAVRLRWGQVLQDIRPRSAALQALLRDSWVERVEGKTIVIGFKHTFHKEKVSETENRRMVEVALEQVLGQSCRVECVLVSGQSSQPIPERRASLASPGTSPRAREATGSPPAATGEPSSAERYRAVTQDPVIQAAVEELGAQVVDVREE